MGASENRVARRRTTGLRGNLLCGLLYPLAVALVLAACAKTEDIERLDESNRIQNERLRALEQSTGESLSRQQQALDGMRTQIEALQRDVKAVRGQTANLTQETVRTTTEQGKLAESVERTLSGQSKMDREFKQQMARIEAFKLGADNQLDKLNGHLAQLEKLLKSPIADLPDKTAGDKAFRAAFYLLVNGELDLAAEHFEQFRTTYPEHSRVTEALYRRGQALFLLRRYDHALIPFFELVDKSPQHRLAGTTRWMLARSLEETGDMKLAREFYTQLIKDRTAYATDATRRLAFINKLFPPTGNKR